MDVKLDISDRSEILRYLGFRNGTIEQKIEDDIADCIRITNEIKDVRFVWRLFDISETEDGIFIEAVSFLLPGKSIVKHLKGSDKAVMFAVTIGNVFDEEVNRLMVSNPSKGVILNSCGITLIEKVADALQLEIDDAIKDYHTGQRFSPGYGDLPLQTQEDFIRAIDATRKAGIRLNRNLMMNPVKSVTAIAGLIINQKTDENLQKPVGLHNYE